MKKIKEKMQFFECFLLNAIKNEENNAIFLMFLVEFDEKWRKYRKLCNFLNVSCLIRWKMKKIKEIMQFFECFFVECDEKWRK
jgi:hypothetical protein